MDRSIDRSKLVYNLLYCVSAADTLCCICRLCVLYRCAVSVRSRNDLNARQQHVKLKISARKQSRHR